MVCNGISIVRRSLCLRLLAGLLVLSPGCGHRRLPGAPTPAEIAEINEVAGKDPAGIRLDYADAKPCPPGACTVESVRPVFDGPPSKIRRIVSADGQHLTVVTDSGEIWHLDISKVAGVTTQAPHPARAAVAGSLGGLALGGLVALTIAFFSGPGPDVNTTPIDPGGHSPSTAAVVGALVGCTLAGALLGVAIDYHSPTPERFQFVSDQPFQRALQR